MDRADVFISYASSDRAHALSLAETLRAEGVDVWIDTAAIGAATLWSAEIAHALENCKALILILSPASVESINVLKEVTLAAEEKKVIIPVELEKVKLPTTFKYHLAGLQRTKIANIEAIKVALFALDLIGATTPTSEPDKATHIEKSTGIAVIPFEDQSASRDNEWFSDGLSDELISTLGKLDGVQVVDKQTSREYKSSRQSAKQIAGELGVRYVVMGSVRKQDNQIRIACSLVDTEKGGTIWDEKFPGTMDDIFEIQDRVAAEIAAGLKIVLTPELKMRIEARPTDDAEAYELLLRANALLSRNTKLDFLAAIDNFERSISIDPNCMSSYNGLTSALMGLYTFYERDSRWLDQAEEVIERMKLHCKDLLQVLVLRAELAALRGDKPAGKAIADEASSMSGGSFDSFNRLAETYAALGEPMRAATMWEYALKLKPEEVTVLFNIMTTYAQYVGDSAKTKLYAKRLLPMIRERAHRNPDDITQQIAYAITMELGGDIAGWDAEISRVLALPQIDGFGMWLAAASLARQGRVEQTIAVLRSVFAKLDIEPEHILSERSFERLREDPTFKEFLEGEVKRLKPSTEHTQ